jgi:hypothetical protein
LGENIRSFGSDICYSGVDGHAPVLDEIGNQTRRTTPNTRLAVYVYHFLLLYIIVDEICGLVEYGVIGRREIDTRYSLKCDPLGLQTSH